MTPVDWVLAEAGRYLGEQERPVASNRSTRIDYWLMEAGAGLGLPWCAAFVSQVGRQALGIHWPMPRTASVVALVAWATAAPTLRWYAEPERGDLVVVWSAAAGRYAHVGFVDAVRDLGGTIQTIEGNTALDGGNVGFGVYRRTRLVLTRQLYFIRWAGALLG